MRYPTCVIVEAELRFDLRHQDREDLPVQIVDDIDEREDDKHVCAVGRARALDLGSVCHARPLFGCFLWHRR